MRQWTRTSAIAILAIVALASVPAPAATTVLQIQLGDSFEGTIDTPGVDTVSATFNAIQGTVARIDVQAAGSDLRPTVLVRDPSGAQVKKAFLWPMPFQNRVLFFFSVPQNGVHTFEIGGKSGSGDFLAGTGGRLPAGILATTLSGTVTNEATGEPLPGITVTVGPWVMVTDENGYYSELLPVGEYTVTFESNDYLPQEEPVTLMPDAPMVLDVGLSPFIGVEVAAVITGDPMPGATVLATAEIEILDGSELLHVSWTQSAGVDAAFDDAEAQSTDLMLGMSGLYKEELLHHLSEPAIGADQLPPNVPPPGEEFPGGIQDRLQVVGINPFALEETGLLVFEVEVTTTSGVYHDEVEVHTSMPWVPNPGLRNVPVGQRVLVQGKEQATYDWILDVPEGSQTVLVDGESRYPEFTPDIPGVYELEVTQGDLEGLPVTLELFASTWRGMVVDQDVDGRPVADGACMGCHSGFAADLFTPWAGTGHAEIFTNNVNTSTHYGPNCFGCHTVGFGQGGSETAEDYEEFINSGLLNNPGDNWTTILEEFPEFARMANIQCENCHGPQGEGLSNDSHGWYEPEGAPRASLSSDVCAPCHGEPLRHARFQQWQLSAHANYELAVDEGDSGNCSRCHTGNGFLAWLPVLLDDDPLTDPTSSIEVTWEADDVHPQTCVICHDPHDIGTTSGINTNATVRISGDTPPLIAGFTATDVGRGAVCMTCHNSRRGLRNDSTFDEYYMTSEAARAPHGSAQTDVLMSQNAYLVEVGERGNHSLVEDTCVSCHMEETPPPDLLAYNSGGTNHTFYASEDICENCHAVGFRADEVQDAVEDDLHELQDMMEDGIHALITDLTDQGNTIDLDGDAEITDGGDVKELVFGEYRGRQSIEVTFIDDSHYGPFRMSDIEVLDAFEEPIGDLYDFADPGLIKAGWNYSLIHNDGSLGAHNPLFAVRVLSAAIEALESQGVLPSVQREQRARPGFMDRARVRDLE